MLVRQHTKEKPLVAERQYCHQAATVAFDLKIAVVQHSDTITVWLDRVHSVAEGLLWRGSSAGTTRPNR